MAPMLAPLDPLVFDDNTPLMADSEIDFAPALVEPEPIAPEPQPVAVARDAKPVDRRRWVLAGSGAAVLVLVGIAATLLGNREPSSAPRPTRATTSAVAPAIIVPATPAPAPPPPLPMDSASVRTAARWLDSLKEAHPVEIPRAPRIVRESAEDRPVADRPVSEDRAAPVQRPAATERPTPRSIVDDPFFIPGSTTTPRAPAKPDTMPTPPR
jgi:hypothetical protein